MPEKNLGIQIDQVQSNYVTCDIFDAFLTDFVKLHDH